MRRLDHCSYRRDPRPGAGGEVADCLLLRALTGLTAAGACAVRRDACEACWGAEPPSADRLNPVIASLLYRLAAGAVARGGAPGLDAGRAAALLARAEEGLDGAPPAPPRLPPCDVVVGCPDSSGATERAVRSALGQRGAAPVVHLVDDGGGGAALLRRFAGSAGVVLHRRPARGGPFAALHDLVPHLRGEFVAVQDPGTVSHPDRLRWAVGRLVAAGAELIGTALETPGGVVPTEEPGRGYRRWLPAPTLVFRRATLADLGGCADRDDADAELVTRALLERRPIARLREPTVAAAGPYDPGPLGPPPRYRLRDLSLRHHARGYPEEAVACDVVLPFCGHLDFVEEALLGAIEQEGAEAVVHLIDDASPDAPAAARFLRRWATHPRVRAYRNARNLGQFLSFNNVAPRLETGLVAVQDADDISRPHRLRRAGNLLRLAGADVFGGRTAFFGDEPGYGTSRYPRPGVGFFLQNPTAVIRTATFLALGGFGDTGDPDGNKCGLDTEFYARAYYAGARFAITREVVLDYRRHAASATANDRTGWGSLARERSEAQNRLRFLLYQRGPFDPRAFGALDAHRGLTRRFP